MSDYRFRLESGERQVGKKLDDIRVDHVNRYQCVIEHLKKQFPDKQKMEGLDIFSATGYGSFLIASNLSCHIDAVDGSDEAIEFAKKYFFHKEISYSVQLYPFIIPENKYDFIVCIESLEHVKQYEDMILEMHKALKVGGLMFLSVPNEDVLSLKKSKNKFHVKHFTRSELMTRYCKKLRYNLHAYYGQDAYVLNDGYISGYLDNNDMNLVKNYSGQWLMMVMQKN